MESILIRLIIAAALLQLGHTLRNVNFCSREWFVRANREVVNIKWRPISVFPEEAYRFR